MRRRLITAHLRRSLASSPAVLLIGPRQCGKTTLARSLRGHYFDLEQEGDRLRLDLEWEALVAGRQLVVLDEAQAHPLVFGRLRGAIDADRKRNGRFLLLGSVSPILMTHVSQSLAGRSAICHLGPLSHREVRAGERDALWMMGGYPDGGVLEAGAYPRWHLDYLTLLAQRDLPQWGLPAKPQVTHRLLRMLAACHGDIWNASKIGAAMGLNYQTVNSYLDYLEGAFLIRRLPPYLPNLRKRLVRRPKVYWRDSGLVHALLVVRDWNHLLQQPSVGASFEGFVIEQVAAILEATGERADLSFFRTSDGYEIDLVLEHRGRRWALETKLTSSPDSRDLERLDRVADLIEADERVLISRATRSHHGGRRHSTNVQDALDLLLSA